MNKKQQYASREISLARQALESNPDDTLQKDRLAWWSAYLSDFSTAELFAQSEKVKSYIEQCKTK